VIRVTRRQRQELVDALRKKGIQDEHVLDAIGRVPRHRFVESGLQHRAYQDEALPIGQKQTISQPFTVAYQTALLDLQEGDRVLEIGTGSGYQAAVLCELGARVFTIERHASLLAPTKRLLESLKYRVMTRHGDGSQGWPAFAPYDAILVTAAASEVPPALIEQLRPPSEDRRGGRLVIPVGSKEGQLMKRITRTGDGPNDVKTESFDVFRFVPLVSDSPL
jgi:protein-L-isoaspartate(D-aspartate) O-methyltransferase